MSFVYTLILALPLTAFAADSTPAVFEAIRNNDQSRLSSFSKADLSATDAKGTTPLMYAAAYGTGSAQVPPRSIHHC